MAPMFRKHKLPKFPPGIRVQFRRFCERLPADEVVAYKQEIDAELKSIEERARDNEMIDLERGRQVARACHLLLDYYAEATAAQQALIVGAIRYFACGEDAFSEETFASGFNDDAKVVNYVLEELGLETGYISLG